MLDLDAIASRRAEHLRQDRAHWLNAVWSPGFQSLSARLTDGEVLELLGLCASADELVTVTGKLGQAPPESTVTPFEWFKAEAAHSGVGLPEFVRRTVEESR